jgi:hypothetical protein
MLVTGHLAGATPAAAAAPIIGLQRVRAVTDFNLASPKTVTAVCPPGKVVIGGGGRAEEQGVPAHKLTLTQLEPYLDSVRYGYRASATNTAPNVISPWRMEAYALCAEPPSGYHIVSAQATAPSQPVQATAAVCPPGERVLGSGAKILNHGSRVALQVARSSGPGDIARAQAREIRPVGSWNLFAFAVCAPPPSGYEVKFEPSPQEASEQVKTAVAECGVGRSVIGAGGAITNVAPGNVALEEAYPDIGTIFQDVRAEAVEVVPTSQNWDFIVAAAICAFAE